MDRLTDLASFRRARALSRYWDSVVHGKEADEAPVLTGDEPMEAELVDLIRRIHHAWDRPAPSQSADDSTLANLLATHQEMITMNAAAFPSPSLRSPGRVAAYDPKTWRRRDQDPAPSRVAMILAASLLVVSAAVVVGLLWSGWLRNDDQRNDPQVVAPSVAIEQASPSPTSSGSSTPLATDDEILAELSLPADQIPAGAKLWTVLAHVTLPPGEDGTWQTNCCGGPMIEYVVAGQYTVRATATVQVIRGGGLTENVAANTEVTLGPGDALISRNETTVDVANRGTEPVELLNWVLIDDPAEGAKEFQGHRISGATEHAFDPSSNIPDLADGAVVSVHRLILSPDERVTPPAGGLMLKVTLDSASETIYSSRDGSFTAGNLANEPTTTVYVVTIEPV